MGGVDDLFHDGMSGFEEMWFVQRQVAVETESRQKREVKME